MSLRLAVAEVAAIVEEAGHISVELLTEVQRTSAAQNRNIATTVDRAIHRFLRKRLLALLPGSRVLSEEGRVSKSASRRIWIVDPIDGTSNVDYGNPHFSVSVALVVNTDVVVGVVCDPLRAELFTAERDRGAFLNGRQISVRATHKVTESIVSVGVPYDKTTLPTAAEAIKRLVLACRDIRRTGSSALDICYVACGRTDAHVEVALSPWDVGAASLVLREAGGRLTNWNATSRPLLVPGSVLASNAVLHARLAALLKKGGLGSTPRARGKRPEP